MKYHHGDVSEIPLSIIIPTLNEGASIQACLTRTITAQPRAEIVIVDGGSDNTKAVVEEFSRKFSNVRYVANPGDRGKGHAIQVGLAESHGDIIVQLDADLQFLPEEIEHLIAPIIQGTADITLGSRFLATSTRDSGSAPVMRSAGNLIISGYTSFLFGHRLTDVLAGFKAWRRAFTESFTVSSDSYSYEAELCIRSLIDGWRVMDVAVTTHPRRAGTSSVRVIKVGAKILYDVKVWRVQAMLGGL